MVQHLGDWHDAIPALEWRAIENAARLAAAGRHSEAEATRYAAGYHAGHDDQLEPLLVV